MILYYNSETGEETHQHPCDEAYRQLFKEKRQELLKKHGKEAGDKSIDTASNGDNPDANLDKSGVSGNDANRSEEPVMIDVRNAAPATSNIMKGGKGSKGTA